MLEKAFEGGKRYWVLVAGLSILILIGLLAYFRQYQEGLTVTGMSRDVPWGFYIAQFTFLVGVAASAVMVVLPYYLHNYREFGKITVLGEFLAIAAVIMCMIFIFVDMGQPSRVVNILLFPTVNSLMFWDFLALGGYLVLNVLITQVTFGAEKKGIAPPGWIKPVIILSIPWAVSIHTVTAFLYSGLEARTFWMTAILAPRFLASAFASGPSLLIILALIVRRFSKFDPGEKAIRTLALIVTYALGINLFFVLVELFTGLYSDIPEHVEHFQYLFFGLEGHHSLVVWIWTSVLVSLAAFLFLLIPRFRNNLKVLGWLAAAVILSVWIEKGLGMVITGFIPSPLGGITEYGPTAVELMVSIGIYGLGALILTVLYKIAISIREGAGA